MNKPECKLIGEDGNAFNLISLTVDCLNKNGMREQASEFGKNAYKSESYDALLNLIRQYVKIV